MGNIRDYMGFIVVWGLGFLWVNVDPIMGNIRDYIGIMEKKMEATI